MEEEFQQNPTENEELRYLLEARDKLRTDKYVIIGSDGSTREYKKLAREVRDGLRKFGIK